jgi:hypothetical protein
VSDHKVADVGGITNCDLGVGSVDLDAVLNVGDQFLTPADNHRSPFDGHVFDQYLYEAFFVKQDANRVLGFRVGCFQVHGLKFTPVFYMLLQFLSFDLELCFAESV